MYRLNETEIWRERCHELLREAQRHSARRNQGIRPHAGLRVVVGRLAPGLGRKSSPPEVVTGGERRPWPSVY